MVEQLILDHTRLVTKLAAQVGEQYRFTGTWRIALTVNGLRHAYSMTAYREMQSGFRTEEFDSYTRDDYRRATESPLDELQDAPEAVVERLVGPLLRSVGSHAEFADLLRPGAGSSRPST